LAKDTDKLSSKTTNLKNGDMIYISNQGVQLAAIPDKVKFVT